MILIEDGRETAGGSVRRLHLEDAPSTASNGLSINTHCPRSKGASSLFPHPNPTPTTVDQGSVSADTRLDAREYIAGRIDSDELVARARARYGLL